MSTYDEEDKNGHGHSPNGFSDAAKDAARDYEEKNGMPPEGESWRLDVLEQWVIVENPVRDYHVLLGPGG